MNLFKTLWLNAKDKLKENMRELSLKAQYKTYIAKKEEKLVISQNNIQDRILSDYSFDDIVSLYEEIEVCKEELTLAKKAYEYIFTKEKEKEISN